MLPVIYWKRHCNRRGRQCEYLQNQPVEVNSRPHSHPGTRPARFSESDHRSGCALAERLCSAAYGREPGSYGVADGDAAGEGDASASVFFFVEDFFVVVDFFVAGAVVVDFFLVVDAASELVVLVVVIDSFLLAHDVIKPTAARTAMDVISDCFISCG